jgi:Peptidase M15
MNDDERAMDEDAPEDASEAGEARGVAVQTRGPAMSPEKAAALDRETLAGLDDQIRGELEEESAEAGPGPRGGPAPVRLAKNFALAEFHCCRGHCEEAAVPSAAVPALRRLARRVLQPMRDEFGQCSVHSGYRNAEHNGHVDGASASHHRYDQKPTEPATDVSFPTGSVDEWGQFARARLEQLGGIGGIGRYHESGFVHIDLGPKRKWTG